MLANLKITIQIVSEKMGVKPDMTEEERQEETELRREAKQKQEQDKCGHLMYLVQGLPREAPRKDQETWRWSGHRPATSGHSPDAAEGR